MTNNRFGEEMIALGSSLRNFAYSLTSNHDDANDLLQDTFLRLGFNYGKIEHDIINGGDKCQMYKITGGIGLFLFNVVNLNININYMSLSPDKPASISRNYFMGNISIELKSF